MVLVSVAGNSIAFLNQQFEEITLNNHSPQQVASDKEQVNCVVKSESCFEFETEGRDV